MEVKEIIAQHEEKMDKTIEALKRELSSIRTGRASTSLLDRITVDYYGTPTPVKQVANVAAPEPRMITIAPWEPKMLGEIENGCRGAGGAGLSALSGPRSAALEEVFMPSGILIIDKPAGWTSMDVCAKVRGIFHEKRVGHGGTLDPMATGVLPVFVGQATRGVEFAENGQKEYVAGLRLGQVTDTQDVTGTTLETRPVTADRAALESLLPRFLGEQDQIPPMYSAVKVGGQKLYDLARKGQVVERKPRRITIYELELLAQESATDYLLRCRCSKGTYIRTLCHDIGRQLGCGGTLYALRRTMAVGFRLEQAVTLEAVQAQGTALLLPTDSLFAEYPALPLTSGLLEKRVRCGNPIPLPGTPDGIYRVYSRDRQFLCLSRAAGGTLTSIKNFFGA